jgi:hypothetical protein
MKRPVAPQSRRALVDLMSCVHGLELYLELERSICGGGGEFVLPGEYFFPVWGILLWVAEVL